MDTENISPDVVNNAESAIPERLRTLPRWKVTNGKNPGHGWNVDENLKTYDKACDHARRVGAAGVIFIMGKGTGLTGADLDHCRNAETGEIEPWAQEIIDQLDSYTEASSSGTGVHIVVEAEKPGPRCRTNAFPGLELYDDARPLLITGDRLNDKNIEPRQQQVEDLYHAVFPSETERDPVDVEPTGLTDTEVLDKLYAEDNGTKWRTVLDGLWGEHYASRSEADFAIAGKLAFYSVDPEQVERIMNGSGLYRDKFDERRGPVTYLQQTVGRVFDKLDSTYTPPDDSRVTVGKNRTPDGSLLSKRVRVGELIRNGIEPPDELISDVLLAGKVHQMFAAGGRGKSWIALWCAKRVVESGGTVLVLDMENGKGITAERMESLGVDLDLLDERFVYIPEPGLTLEEVCVNDYVSTLDKLQPQLVIFDSWINYIAGAGLDENVSGDIAKWAVNYTHPARSREITVLLLDHVPKDGSNSRGSGRKRDEVDVQWALKNTLPFDRDTTGEIVLKREKDREGWLPLTVTFSVGGSPEGDFTCSPSAGTTEYTGDDGLTPSMREMWEALLTASVSPESLPFAGLSAKEWLQKSPSVSRSWFYKNLNDVRLKSRITKRNGRYFPQSPGGKKSPQSSPSLPAKETTKPRKSPQSPPPMRSRGETGETRVDKRTVGKTETTEPVRDATLSNGFRELHEALTDGGVDLTPQHFFALVEPHMAEHEPMQAWLLALTGDPKAVSWSEEDLQRAIEGLGT